MSRCLISPQCCGILLEQSHLYFKKLSPFILTSILPLWLTNNPIGYIIRITNKISHFVSHYSLSSIIIKWPVLISIYIYDIFIGLQCSCTASMRGVTQRNPCNVPPGSHPTFSLPILAHCFENETFWIFKTYQLGRDWCPCQGQLFNYFYYIILRHFRFIFFEFLFYLLFLRFCNRMTNKTWSTFCWRLRSSHCAYELWSLGMSSLRQLQLLFFKRFFWMMQDWTIFVKPTKDFLTWQWFWGKWYWAWLRSPVLVCSSTLFGATSAWVIIQGNFIWFS